MKLSITFVKDHPSGLKEGRTVEFEFTHSARLISEGFAKAAEGEDLEAKTKEYEDGQAEIAAKIKARTDQIKAERDAEEERKELMRQKNHSEGSSKHARMSTADIKSEEPKNTPRGRGGKNK